MVSFVPLLARARAKITNSSSFRRQSLSQAEILSPPSTFDEPAAIALPGEWERVQALSEGSLWELEKANVAGGVRTHPATTGYCVRDVLWADGCAYDGLSMLRVAPRRGPLWVPGRPERVGRAQLCLTNVSARFFGHWLIDQLLLELLAEQRGLPALTQAVPQWPHAAGYRELARLHPLTPRLARVEELWIVDDIHSNAGRRARLQELRRRMRRPDAASPARIFLDRGVTGAARTLTNRAEILTVLEGQGFTPVYPEQETPARLAELLSNARLCVGVEGSALTHAIMLLPAGAGLISLMPPARFTAIIKTYADMAGIRSGYVVGDPQGDGFSIDRERLLATLAMIDADR